MKNLKFFVMAVLLVAGVGTLLAFSNKESHDAFQTKVCFQLKAGVNPADVTAVRIPSNWVKIPCTSAPTCGTTKVVICYLRVLDDNDHIYNRLSATPTPKVDADFDVPSGDQLNTDLGIALGTPKTEINNSFYDIFLKP